MLNYKTFMLAAGAVGLMATGSLTPVSAADYSGKAFTMIVGASPAGGQTRGARAWARHLGKYMPGNPKFIVKNLPGAAGNKSKNFIYNKAKKDGFTLHWGPMNQMGHLLKLKGVNFDPAKFQLIGAGDVSYYSLIMADTGKGLKSAADLLKTEGIIFGGRAPHSNLDIYGRVPLELFGIKYRYVVGYKGSSKISPALQAGEINMASAGNPGYNAFYKNGIVKEGKAIGLYYHSAMNEKGEATRFPGYFGKAKHFIDYYKDVTGKEPSGDLWEAYKWVIKFAIWPFSFAAPPGAPAEVVADLRKAYLATRDDAAFKADWEKTVGPIHNFVGGKEATWLLTDYKNASPATIRGMNQLTGQTAKKRKKKKKK